MDLEVLGIMSVAHWLITCVANLINRSGRIKQIAVISRVQSLFTMIFSEEEFLMKNLLIRIFLKASDQKKSSRIF